MNPTSSGSHFEPPFFNYIKPYMIYFNDRDNPKEKKKKFTRNSESKEEFFTKHPQVNIFCLGPFLTLIFDF